MFHPFCFKCSQCVLTCNRGWAVNLSKRSLSCLLLSISICQLQYSLFIVPLPQILSLSPALPATSCQRGNVCVCVFCVYVCVKFTDLREQHEKKTTVYSNSMSCFQLFPVKLKKRGVNSCLTSFGKSSLYTGWTTMNKNKGWGFLHTQTEQTLCICFKVFDWEFVQYVIVYVFV